MSAIFSIHCRFLPLLSRYLCSNATGRGIGRQLKHCRCRSIQEKRSHFVHELFSFFFGPSLSPAATRSAGVVRYLFFCFGYRWDDDLASNEHLRERGQQQHWRHYSCTSENASCCMVFLCPLNSMFIIEPGRTGRGIRNPRRPDLHVYPSFRSPLGYSSVRLSCSSLAAALLPGMHKPTPWTRRSPRPF